MSKNNDLLEKRFKLAEKIKKLTEEKREIDELLKVKGTFATTDYICNVSIVPTTRLKGLKDVSAVFGMDALERANLIILGESIRITVKPKTKRAA